MIGQTGTLMVRALGVAALVAGFSTLRPAAAEAQGRGTLQVYAQVVDTKAGYDGISAARSALLAASTRSGAAQLNPVTTLAHVSVAYPSEQRSGVVVTIDYSKN